MSQEIRRLSHELETHRFELEVSIQELQEANVLLKEKEEFLSSMFENASEGILVINHIGLIESANYSIEEILGFERNSIIGKPINLFLDKGIKPGFNSFLVHDYLNKVKFEAVTILNHRDIDKIVHTKISLSKINKSGKNKFLLIITDISEKVASENELIKVKKEKKRLLEINKELDRFVYRVSHDLKAPLASSLGLINIIEREKDKSQIDQYLQLQKLNIGRLQDFINNILQYSRNSSLEVKVESIDFNTILNELIEQIKFSKEATKIDFKVFVTQKGNFLSDTMRIKIILSNLISNAVKYSDPNKGEKFIDIAINADEDFTEITIEDNGIGIEEEYLEEIFRPFFRATELSKGSGIGLTLVKEALHKVHGTLNLESTFKKGSRFTIYLAAIESKKAKISD